MLGFSTPRKYRVLATVCESLHTQGSLFLCVLISRRWSCWLRCDLFSRPDTFVLLSEKSFATT